MKRKILFITQYYSPNIVGGAEISTQIIAEGVDAESIVLTASDCDAQRILNNVKVIQVRRGLLSRGWKKVLIGEKKDIVDRCAAIFFNSVSVQRWEEQYKSIIKQECVDLVIINTNVDGLGRKSCWKAGFDAGIPVVLVLRDPILIRKKLFGIDVSKYYIWMIKKQLKYIYRIVSPSHYMIDLYKRRGIEKKNSVVIPNVVDCDFVCPDFSQKKDEVLYAGSIRKEKGIGTLLGAMENLKTIPDAHLSLYGSGDMEQMCKECRNVNCYGWIKREDLYRRMRCSKVVVLPSEYPEAFGRILVESVSQGTIVIGSDSGGIPEILGDDSRYLFRSGDIIDLSEKIERILNLSERDYINEINELQKKFTKYNKKMNADNWNSLIDDILFEFDRELKE